MKKVFGSHSEVAHVWAQQTQDEGRAGNIFFVGSIIYSYGHHFAAANIIKEDIVLINNNNYSVSTAKHLGIISGAVSHLKQFNVKNVAGFNWSEEKDTELHNQNVADYVERINETLKKASKARTKKLYLLQDATNDLHELNDYISVFGLGVTHEFSQVESFVGNEISATILASIKKEQAVKQAKLKAENAEKIQAWINNEPNSYINRNIDFIYLRIKGDQVETSLGANVPIKEAQILYNRIVAGKSVIGFKIGYYTVTSINSSRLVIGCHKLSLKEVHRIGKELLELKTV